MTTFTLNNKTYRTDAEMLEVLRGVVPSAKESDDGSAVIAVLSLGLMTGRIVEVVTE